MQNKIEIKSPCTMDWNEMAGGETVRHCSKCRFNVYNFTEMTQTEIDDQLDTEDRVCGRLYMRPDGTYMTKNCRAKVKRNKILKWTAVAAMIPLSFLLFISGKDNKETYLGSLKEVPVAGSVVNFIFPVLEPELEQMEVLVGEMCAPAPTPIAVPAPVAPIVEKEGEGNAE